jgi:hypothetical protein
MIESKTTYRITFEWDGREDDLGQVTVPVGSMIPVDDVKAGDRSALITLAGRARRIEDLDSDWLALSVKLPDGTRVKMPWDA